MIMGTFVPDEWGKKMLWLIRARLGEIRDSCRAARDAGNVWAPDGVRLLGDRGVEYDASARALRWQARHTAAVASRREDAFGELECLALTKSMWGAAAAIQWDLECPSALRLRTHSLDRVLDRVKLFTRRWLICGGADLSDHRRRARVEERRATSAARATAKKREAMQALVLGKYIASGTCSWASPVPVGESFSWQVGPRAASRGKQCRVSGRKDYLGTICRGA